MLSGHSPIIGFARLSRLPACELSWPDCWRGSESLCRPGGAAPTFFQPFDRFLLMRQKIKKYVQAFFVIFQPSSFFEQAYGFIGALQVGVVLNKMKQISIFKAGIGKGDAITGLLCKYGCVFQRFIRVVIAVENAPDSVAVFRIVGGRLEHILRMADKVFCRLVLGRNRDDIYKAVSCAEMPEIFGFRFFALANDVDDRPAFPPGCSVGIVFFPHSCHNRSPPINGMAPKRPCR